MSLFFQLRRFLLQFRKSVAERPMGVWGTFIMNLGGTFLIYFFFESQNAFRPAQFIAFAVGLVVGSCLIASIVFGHFSSEANGISFLTLPGSAFEKWLVGFLITLLYIGLFLAFFRFMDRFFVDMYHHKLNPNDPRYREQYANVWVYHFFSEKETFVFLSLSVAIMLIGGVRFNRLAFIKTAILILILLFALFALNGGIARLMLPGVVRSNPFQSVTLLRDGNEANIWLPDPVQHELGIVLGIVFPAALLLLSYFKLREKEI